MLAIFTYYVESDGEAYIVDPTYDYLAYRDFIAKRGATLKYVVLTHYHADFLGGHT
jgi:glyoxylase-like metal-dependent hydrolase (beta-lactamase superfamily II)